MIKDIVKYIFSFILFVLIQVLVVNQIHLGWVVNPFIYIVFILLLPIEIRGWLLLVIGFVLGITIDSFSNTPGMHAAASVLIAYIRPSIHRVMIPRDTFQPGTQPSMATFGFPWFLKYTIVMTLIHHTAFFMLEAFSVEYIGVVMLKALGSSVATVLLILLVQLFTLGNRKQR